MKHRHGRDAPIAVPPERETDEPYEFSLVEGGPFHRLLLRTGLMGPHMDLLGRRIVVLALVAWLPLLVLTILSGHAIAGIGTPFLLDLDPHIRCLLYVPLLLAAEVVAHGRIQAIVGQFTSRGVVAPEDQPQLESAMASAMRLRDSTLPEVLLLGLTYAGASVLWEGHFALNVPTWIAAPVADSMQFTPAGNYYFFVGLMIPRFLWLRWYFRLFIWACFLWEVARHVPLKLNALHPDRAGGLGFLGRSGLAFGLMLFANSLPLAAAIGGKIWHEGATLLQFKIEIAAWMVFQGLLVLTPLCFFVIQMSAARRAGVREYGIVASRYVAGFRRKWIEGDVAEGEVLAGATDFSSLADLGSSFEVTRKMQLVPFGRSTIMQLAIVMALPLLPLTLTMLSLDELIDRVIGVFF
jgi:hypothetical protein